MNCVRKAVKLTAGIEMFTLYSVRLGAVAAEKKGFTPQTFPTLLDDERRKSERNCTLPDQKTPPQQRKVSSKQVSVDQVLKDSVRQGWIWC